MFKVATVNPAWHGDSWILIGLGGQSAAQIVQLALETIEFVVERRMLIGIRERAERTATSAIPPAPRSRRAGLRTATDARRETRRAPARQPTDRAMPAARERLSLPLSGARRSTSSPTCHLSET